MMVMVKDWQNLTTTNGYEVSDMKAAVVKETAPGERRVALVPDAVAKLRPAGIEVLVERGAGQGAWLTDAAYADAGATIVGNAELFASADVILTVTKPSTAMMDQLGDRKSTRLNSSHMVQSRMPSSA